MGRNEQFAVTTQRKKEDKKHLATFICPVRVIRLT